MAEKGPELTFWQRPPDVTATCVQLTLKTTWHEALARSSQTGGHTEVGGGSHCGKETSGETDLHQKVTQHREGRGADPTPGDPVRGTQTGQRSLPNISLWKRVGL